MKYLLCFLLMGCNFFKSFTPDKDTIYINVFKDRGNSVEKMKKGFKKFKNDPYCMESNNDSEWSSYKGNVKFIKGLKDRVKNGDPSIYHVDDNEKSFSIIFKRSETKKTWALIASNSKYLCEQRAIKLSSRFINESLKNRR